MNVALRAVHDALAGRGTAAAEWSALVTELHRRVGPDRRVDTAVLRASLRAAGCDSCTSGWLPNLRSLGVLDEHAQLDLARADAVTSALELAADSFTTLGAPPYWAPVATVPEELRAFLRPPPVRQTAGVFLDLIDRAVGEVRIAAPFVDRQAIDFLADPLLDAGRRAVAVTVITSPGQAAHFTGLGARWSSESSVTGGIRICEVRSLISTLGSHAKLLVVDGERGYVGSANLTSAALRRHVEIGVEVSGPQTAELTRILAALERLASTVVAAGGRASNACASIASTARPSLSVNGGGTAFPT